MIGAASCHVGWTTLAGIGDVESLTWQRWGTDGDGDGRVDPLDLDDAAAAAAAYLCADDPGLGTGAGWTRAILSHHHSTSYVRAVYDAASAYAERSR